MPPAHPGSALMPIATLRRTIARFHKDVQLLQWTLSLSGKLAFVLYVQPDGRRGGRDPLPAWGRLPGGALPPLPARGRGLAFGRRRAAMRDARAGDTSPRIGGDVAPGFEGVRAEFERNFTERGEVGAAVAAYWRGEKVVDLWGGRRAAEGDAPWEADTMVIVHSSTKGVMAMTLAVAVARGYLDYDAPVARYWPEFAQHGKGEVTVRQLLGHEAGLAWLDQSLALADVADLDRLANLLARQRPRWIPGTRHGYHAMTLGLYAQALLRRADPEHRTLGRLFRDELGETLGVDFYIGLPPQIPDARLARIMPLSAAGAFRALPTTPWPLLARVIWPWSRLHRSMLFNDADWNDRRSLEVELPAGNGVGTARALARLYSAFAEGGGEVGVGPEVMAQLTAPARADLGRDWVLGVESRYHLGFLRPAPGAEFGVSERAFGTPGAGGSFGMADPDGHVGYAYVMNKTGYYLFDDPREKPLRDALYRAIRARAAEGRAKREATGQGAPDHPPQGVGPMIQSGR